MAQYPDRRTLPPYLAGAGGQAPDHSRILSFDWLRGTFVSKHTGGKPVSIVRVTDWNGFEKALLFKTPLNEDLDGAPKSYAPPISAANLNPLGGLTPLDHIKNATNQKGDVFHDDPAHNTFSWTGVVSVKAELANGRRIDDRPFLGDRDKRFPVFQPATSATSQYYAPQTAMAAIDGQEVNPLEVPYAALSTSLQENGHVSLGDFGLAIRPSTGSYTGFFYGDAAGNHSTSVGECSRKMIRELFEGRATGEDICYIVFPGTAFGELANPTLITPRVRHLLGDLAQFGNAGEVVRRLLFPYLLEAVASLQISRDLAEGDPFRQVPANIVPVVDDVGLPVAPDVSAWPAYRRIFDAMRRAGFA